MRSLSLDAPAHARRAERTPGEAFEGRGDHDAQARTPDRTASSRAVDAPAHDRSAEGRTAAPEPAREDLREVVSRARAGEPDAFGVLYDRYSDLIYRFVYYRVGTHALAEDLTSETFLRALRRISLFTWQGKDFGAWLVTIARNLVLDHFKSSRYRLEVCTADPLEPEAWEEGPERAVLDSFTYRALFSAVRELGTEQRECVVLRFLHGLSVAETAEIMGKNTGAIKALQYRAIRSLARLFPADIR